MDHFYGVLWGVPFFVVPLITGGQRISLKGWFKGFVSMASGMHCEFQWVYGGEATDFWEGFGRMTTIGPIYVGQWCPRKPLKKGSQGGIGKRTLIVFVGDSPSFFSVSWQFFCKFQDVVFLLFLWQSLSPINNWYISVLDTKSVIWRTSTFRLVVTCWGNLLLLWKKEKFQDPGFDKQPTLIPESHVCCFPSKRKQLLTLTTGREQWSFLTCLTYKGCDAKTVRETQGRKFTKW